MHLNFSSASNVNSPLASNANCVQGNTHWDCKVQLSISTVRHFVTLKENEVPFTHKIDYVGQMTSHIQETCFTALQTSYYFSTNRNKPIKQESNHTTWHFHIYRNSHKCVRPESRKIQKNYKINCNFRFTEFYIFYENIHSLFLTEKIQIPVYLTKQWGN